MRKTPSPDPAEEGEPEDLEAPAKPAAGGHLVEDGRLTVATDERVQHALGVKVDGTWESRTVRFLQQRVGARRDGMLGPATIRALQAHVGATVDGAWSSVARVYNSGHVVFDAEAKSETTRKIQKAITEGTF